VLGRGDELPNGRVHTDDPARSGGRHIDVVDPDPGATDHLQIRRSDE